VRSSRKLFWTSSSVPSTGAIAQGQVTLAPVRRGEGWGEGSARLEGGSFKYRERAEHGDAAPRPCDPLTLALSPEDGGEGIGGAEDAPARSG